MTQRETIKISDLSSRVAVCSMKDVVEQNGQMELRRKEIAKLWACIRPNTSTMSFMSSYGYAVLEPADRKTHNIYIRRKTYLDITSAAWVYEQRRITAPLWYKVLGFYEEDCWIVMATHLQERSDQAQPPQGDLSPQPSKVLL
jgi:head-tail adaptor